jgi:hypothetical protein
MTILVELNGWNSLSRCNSASCEIPCYQDSAYCSFFLRLEVADIRQNLPNRVTIRSTCF